jgi:outer membrane biosynthesis protein TonB
MGTTEELENSLRVAIDGYINPRLSDVREQIARLQSQINEAFAQLLAGAASEMPMDASLISAITQHLQSAYQRGREEAEAARSKVSSELPLLKAAIDEIDDQRTQVDILGTLVNRAASFAPRTIFFVVKQDRITGWRARGVDGIDDTTLREISLPVSSDTLLSEAIKTRSTWSGEPGAHPDDLRLLSRLWDNPPQRVVAIPLVARGKAAAVLYADSSNLGPEEIKLEALEALVRVAGMAVELLAIKRAPAPAVSRPRIEKPEPAVARPAASSTPPPTPPEVAPAPVAEAAPPEPVAPEPGGAPEAPPVAAAVVDERPAPVAEAHLETPPPVAAAHFETPPPVFAEPAPPAPQAAPEPAPAATTAPLGTARRYGRADADLPIEVSEEEKRLHTDARRFARLLVSEIKLYNEQKVKEGREVGDLYNRLREEIDRSRQMYEKRVSPNVAARYDYFHHELINTLAEGDPAKLGHGYPGSSVPV